MNRLVFVRIIIRRIIYISRTIVDKYVLNYKNGCKLFQGGQSRCLADWVHELYEPVIGQHMSGKSFKRLLYKVKFHAVEYKKKPSCFSAPDCVKVSPGFVQFSSLPRTNEVCTQSRRFFLFSSFGKLQQTQEKL